MRAVKLPFVALFFTLVTYAALQGGHAEPPSQKVVHRKVEIKGLRFPTGNVTTYRIPLERDTLYTHELDNNLGFSVGSPLKDDPRFPGATPQLDAFIVEVEKDEKGRVSKYSVVLGAVRYFDLNGDGHIDRMFDSKTRRAKILVDGCFVDVQHSLDPRTPNAKSLDGRTTYAFRGNSWKVANQR